MKENVYIRSRDDFYFKELLEVLKPTNNLSHIPLDFKIEELSPINKTIPNTLTFFKSNEMFGNKNVQYLPLAKAKFCIIGERDLSQFSSLSGMVPVVVAEDAFVAFLKVCKAFFIKKNDSARIAPKVKIMDNVYIGNNVTIEDGAQIYPNVFLEDCVIKAGSVVFSNSCIQKAIIGTNCIIHCGAKIGQDGFGFIHSKGDVIKVDHFGCVIVGDNVEIGANSCVDRGTIEDTIIESNVKIDNLVQIAHNVKIGNNTVIAGQTGIAGSATIGSYCMIGGQVGIVGHIEIGSYSIVYGRSSVSKSFPEKSKIFSGWAAEDYNKWVGKIIFFNFLYSKMSALKALFRFMNKIVKIKSKIVKLFK